MISTQPENAQTPPPEDIVGMIVGERYQILSSLKAGGMGIVYRARHVVLGKPLAIKVLREAGDEAARRRFLLEAQMASMLNHSNIVDVIDYGVLPTGLPYLVMEFLEGKTLEQVLIEAGPLSAPRVCHIGAQIARGLQVVHDHGIIHRDLKPPNIFLLEREGQHDVVKIVDFGVAKARSGPQLTAAGMTMGTAEYMSPEQGLGSPLDPRSDQYALGCLLYEMLTNQLPFDGADPTEILLRHISEPVIPPRQICPELHIPEPLEAIVLRLLAKQPGDRYPSMNALELLLLGEAERMMQQLDLAFPGPSGGTPEITICTPDPADPMDLDPVPPDEEPAPPFWLVDAQHAPGPALAQETRKGRIFLFLGLVLLVLIGAGAGAYLSISGLLR